MQKKRACEVQLVKVDVACKPECKLRLGVHRDRKWRHAVNDSALRNCETESRDRSLASFFREFRWRHWTACQRHRFVCRPATLRLYDVVTWAWCRTTDDIILKKTALFRLPPAIRRRWSMAMEFAWRNLALLDKRHVSTCHLLRWKMDQILSWKWRWWLSLQTRQYFNWHSVSRGPSSNSTRNRRWRHWKQRTVITICWNWRWAIWDGLWHC